MAGKPKKTVAKKTTVAKAKPKAKAPAKKKRAPCKPKATKPVAKKKVVKKAKVARKVYNVTTAAKGGWEVKGVGAKAHSGRFDKKTDAVSRAKELAKKAKKGQVVVYKTDGKIQTKYAYDDTKS